MERSLLYQVGHAPSSGRASGADASPITNPIAKPNADLAAWVADLHLAEEVGLTSVWCFPVAGEEGDFGGSAPVVWLAALAARTERLRLGWGVPGMMPPAKPPFRIAEQAAALDLASKGRLDFAVLPDVGGAAGPADPETEAESSEDAGADAGDDAWDEGARMLVEMWDAPAFSWTSARFEVMPIDVVPKPVQRPHPPIWYAGWSAAHAHRAGVGGMSYLDLSGAGDEAIGAHLNAYRRARASVAAADLLSISAFAAAAEIAPNALGSARLARWEELGVDQAVMPLSYQDTSREEAEQKIRFLAESAGNED